MQLFERTDNVIGLDSFIPSSRSVHTGTVEYRSKYLSGQRRTRLSCLMYPIFKLLLTKATFFFNSISFPCPFLYSLGKELRSSVCGKTGRKDKVRNLEATSNDVLEVPDTTVV
jgi:hypothetical protein